MTVPKGLPAFVTRSVKMLLFMAALLIDVSHALTFFVPPSVLSTNHQTVKNSTNLLMSVLVAMNRKNAGKIMLIMPPIELIQRINVTYEILIKASECHQKH